MPVVHSVKNILVVAKCKIQLQDFSPDVIMCRQEVFRITGRAKGLLGTVLISLGLSS